MAEAYISGLTAAGALTGTELLEVSQVSTTVVKTAATLSALASDNSYNDSGSGFVTAGFAVGDRVRVTGFTGNVANNIVVGKITALTAAKMTIGGADGNVIVDDAAGETVTIAKWLTRRTTAQEIAALAGATPAPLTIETVTGTTYTLALGDAGKHKRFTAATAVALTIPTNASVAFPIGTRIRCTAAGAGTVTISGAGVTLNSRGAALASAGQYAVFDLEKVATNEWDILGDLA
jgi:hypothetical protein